MSILTKIKEIFFPTKITEQPFPNVSPATSVNSSETKDVYYPTEISPKEFAIPNIATGLRSTTLDTESRQIMNNFTFSTYGAMTIGEYATGNGIRISPNGIIGINGGVTKFTLSSDGNFVTTGFIQVGGAAADVNGVPGTTIIAPGKIQVSGSTTLADWRGTDTTTIDGGKIYAGSQIVAGTGNDVGVLSGSDGTYRIWAGHATAASAPFRVTQTGIVTATGVVISGALTTGASSSISADYITAGTISVGGTSQPNAIYIKSDNSHGDSNLRWEHGSRLWEDGSNQLGVRSAGSLAIFYTGNYETRLVLNNGANQSYFTEGTGLRVNKGSGGTGNFNVEGDARVDGNFTVNADHIVINGSNNLYLSDSCNFHNDGGVSHLAFGNGKQLVMNADKTAIVPTTKGYRALYTMESPEVWFVDFCPGKKKYWWKFWDEEYELHPDPLFVEVTEKPYIAMPTLIKGIVQIYGKRKGHTQRFEEKTEKQFKKNNDFWDFPNK